MRIAFPCQKDKNDLKETLSVPALAFQPTKVYRMRATNISVNYHSFYINANRNIRQIINFGPPQKYINITVKHQFHIIVNGENVNNGSYITSNFKSNVHRIFVMNRMSEHS